MLHRRNAAFYQSHLEGHPGNLATPWIGQRYPLRALLYSSVLTGGLLMVNGAIAPAYAVPCSTAVNGPNTTQCIGGATAATLDYSPIIDGNAGYVGGDFTLQLQSHDVVSGGNGIEFSGVQAGVGNDGTILLDGDSDVSATLNGILAEANGATTTIEVNGTSSVVGGLAGINAQSSGGGGNVTVTTVAGTTVSSNALGAGILANAAAAGNVVVNAQGGVSAIVAAGITASAATGTVGVTTGATAISGGTFGIDANATANTATVTTGAGAVVATEGTGIEATGDTVVVHAGGNVSGNSTVANGNGFGINAVADNGTVNVTTAAGTTVTGADGVGINAEASGDVTVDPDGNVSGSTLGINAVSNVLGNVNVTTFAGTTVGGGAGDGINAETTTAGNTGNVVVNAQSAVTGAGAGSIGIDANAIEGTVQVTTGTAAVSGVAGGIDATAAGAVAVNAGGNVSGTGGFGINAVAQNGLVDVNTAEGFTVDGNGGAGIFANAAVTGDVDVDALGTVIGSTIGIDANSTAGSVNVTTGTGANTVTGEAGAGIDATAATTVTVAANANVTGNGAGGIGINAVSQNGLVDVDTAADTIVDGNGGAGIFANAAVTGDVDVDALGAVVGSTIGIDANATAGAVAVTTGTNTVAGEAGNGIDATASGAVTVETNGIVVGTGGTGINAVSSAAGAINVTTNQAVNTQVVGTNGDGINAETNGAGTITITNNVITVGSDTGIEATSAGGTITIHNNFGIANISENDADLAIRTTGGATTINNNGVAGVILGRIVTGAGNDTLNNNFLWFTEGESNFGDGDDEVNVNAGGRLFAANEASVDEETSFVGLETLNNFDTISLLDQLPADGSNISDSLSTNGNYVGMGQLGVDAFLGGVGSLSDQLIIGGSVSGVTQIVVNDTNAGAGGFDPNGILVVNVSDAGTADATNFVLAGGPIDKGLFVYDLLFDDPVNEYLLVGLPDQEVFETLAAVASAQEIWRETADAWSTRQENLRDVLAQSHTVTAVADPGVTVSEAPMASLWVSALGSWLERDDEASFSLLNANLDFDLSYSQDIYGVVGGADFRTSIGSDSSLLFGVMGGYVDSQLDFDDTGTSIDTSGGTVGAYAALMSNGFFLTVLGKADLLNMDYSAAGDDDSADVTSYGARADLGFRLGDSGLFLEPMLSFDAISTKIDEFEITGTEVDAGTNDSFRGGAGLRAGYGDEDIRASATARVWDVFSTENEVDIPGLTVTDDDLEGVYGDVSAQIDVSLSTNATIYLKGGVLFSDDVTKPNASGGFALYW